MRYDEPGCREQRIPKGESSMAAKTRLYRYDVLRVLACLSIIVYHFETESANSNELPPPPQPS